MAQSEVTTGADRRLHGGQFAEALVVKDERSESSEETYARDRARLLADMAGNKF